jgi:hypothetical protein
MRQQVTTEHESPFSSSMSSNTDLLLKIAGGPTTNFKIARADPPATSRKPMHPRCAAERGSGQAPGRPIGCHNVLISFVISSGLGRSRQPMRDAGRGRRRAKPGRGDATKSRSLLPLSL